MRSALDIASYFLSRVDKEAGKTISAKKLQKLVYYAQAWYLAFRGEPLFSEVIRAWKHGPVVYEVWNEYKEFQHKAIPQPEKPTTDFGDLEREILDQVWSTYGELGAKRLEDLTHLELPWCKARSGLIPTAPSSHPIRHEDMKEYYAHFIAGTDPPRIDPQVVNCAKQAVRQSQASNSLEELSYLVTQLQSFQPLRASNDMRSLAQQALAAMKKRQDENVDVEQWAAKLASDIAGATD